MDVLMGNVGTGVAKPQHKRAREDAAKNKQLVLGRIGHNGKKNLRKLSTRHLTIIALHLEGSKSGPEIAKDVGCSSGMVYTVLQDPLAKDIIEKFRTGQLDDIKSLYPLVFDALRDALENGSRKEKLSAMGRFQDFVKQADGTDNDRGNHNGQQVIDARQQFVQIINQISGSDNGLTTVTPTKEILE